ncbi:uncharacterized protein VTP21DRAFT_5915 [Calcarisporiella thermophila]|uniref:uncharacterized protein n=1 Tax=Calcarisporiella thermophila TaxID=911321 RepID=UPI0037428D77
MGGKREAAETNSSLTPRTSVYPSHLRLLPSAARFPLAAKRSWRNLIVSRPRCLRSHVIDVPMRDDSWANKELEFTTHGLPTLEQVLACKTYAPLSQQDLYNFLRRRQHAEENLDFWMDIEAHEQLWRRYQRELRTKSKEKEYPNSSESSAEAMKLYHNPRDPDITLNLEGGNELTIDIPSEPLSIEDLRISALRIYERFCSPYDPYKRTLLPEDHRLALQELVEVQRCAEPSVFTPAKHCVYDVLNRHFYPQFLNHVCFTNITLTLARTVLFPMAVLFLTGGFAMELCFVFLDYGGRLTRLWGILPIFTGWMCLLSSIFEFLPLVVLFRSR